MKLVEIKALQPFSGSYVCALADADVIDDQFVEDEATGSLVKKRVPRKRFKATIPVQRRAWPTEVATWRESGVPSNVTLITDLKSHEVWIEERPATATAKVPEAIANDLIARGLAEKIAA